MSVVWDALSVQASSVSKTHTREGDSRPVRAGSLWKLSLDTGDSFLCPGLGPQTRELHVSEQRVS